MSVTPKGQMQVMSDKIEGLHMAVLQSASLDPKDEIFLSRVTHHALKVFSSIDNLVKENAQVIFELEKLREKKKSMYEQSKLSTDQSIYRLEKVKTKYHA